MLALEPNLQYNSKLLAARNSQRQARFEADCVDQSQDGHIDDPVCVIIFEIARSSKAAIEVLGAQVHLPKF